MDEREALAVLGLRSPIAMVDIRSAYRRLVRAHHPDVAGAAAGKSAARLTEAYAVLRAAGRAHHDVVDLDAIDRSRAASGADRAAEAADPAAPDTGRRTAARTPYEEAVEAELAAGDTLLVRAPAGETFAALFEAAGSVGHIAYFDRQLGIIETIVRFEGGPSCSLLITLQGRVDGTEAFLTLESIEADPTPPMHPVVEALVGALTDPR